MVQIGESTEETHGGALAVGNDQTLLAAALDLEHLDDGTGPADGRGDDLLVDRLGVGGGLLQEPLLTNDLDVGLVW